MILLCSVPPYLLSRCFCSVFWVSLYYFLFVMRWQGTPMILAILYADVTMFLFCRVFSDAASRTMPCTRVRGRGTAWSTEPTGTAANTVACRSAWRSAWAVMVSASLAHQLTENWILETRTQIKVLHMWRGRVKGQLRQTSCQQLWFLQLFGFIQLQLDWLDDHDVKMWRICAWFNFKFKYLRYV